MYIRCLAANFFDLSPGTEDECEFSRINHHMFKGFSELYVRMTRVFTTERIIPVSKWLVTI